MRVSAERHDGDADGLAQAGFVQTNGLAISGGCNEVPALTQYVEFKIFNTGSDYFCEAYDYVGGTVANSLYSVIHELSRPDYWAAYINHAFRAERPVGFVKASWVLAGGELATRPGYPQPWGEIYGCFGCGTDATPWQRTADSYDPGTPDDGLAWTTIKRSRTNNSGDRGWTLEPTPSPFRISHPYQAPQP
jgi:hypothetical protein